MPKATKTSTKQRSVKNRSLSSSRSKGSKATKAATKPTATRKPRAPRKPAVKTNDLIRLPLGGGKHLTITVSQPKKKVAKKPTPNRPSKKLTIALLVVGFCGTIFFGLHVLAAPAPPLVQPRQIAQKHVTAEVAMPSMPRSVPTHLRIPDIQLDADLQTVGLKADGSLDVPADYWRAGWYEASPTPGEIGPAIIDGHLDNIHGIAVFWRLRELVPGQTIEVDRQDGSTAHFVIDDVKQFAQDSFPTSDVYGNTNQSSLRLITCGGTFNRLSGHYDHNTIVFASLKK